MDEEQGVEMSGDAVGRQVVFNPPSADSPGYLRRSRQALEMAQQLDPRVPESIDMIIEFLLPYVVAPHNRDEAREALLDATETQYRQLLDAVMGGGPGGPLPKSGRPGA